MFFNKTALEGVFLLMAEEKWDERGFFARIWCKKEFEKHGLNPSLHQCSISFNLKKGTLRGLHFQKAPFEEAKLVLCSSGAIYDVVLDLRPASSTYGQWMGVELSRENRQMLYIPEGCAHGFQTLSDHAEVYYHISKEYEPSAADGVRWNDPAFNIAWPPETERIISERDQSWPDYQMRNYASLPSS